MSINLLELATHAIGSDFGRQAAQFLGEPQGVTQTAVKAAVPAILDGMAQKASHIDGARSLLSTLSDTRVDSGLLSNVSSMFAGGGASVNSLIGTGTSLLGSLFGDKVGSLASALGSISGMKTSAAGSLFSLVALPVFGFIKKYVSDNRLDAGGLVSLFGGQTRNLQGALDSRLSSVLGSGAIAGTAAETVRRATATTESFGIASGATETIRHTASTQEPHRVESQWSNSAAPQFVQHMQYPHLTHVRRISWGAVLAGVVMALVIELLLSVLGTGIGMSSVQPLASDTAGGSALGRSAGVWWAISSIIALFIGGWVAAHLAGIPERLDGVLHGLLTWGLASLAGIYLLGSLVGSVISGASNLVSGTVSATARGVAAVAPELKEAASSLIAQTSITGEDIKRQARLLLTGKPEAQPAPAQQPTASATDQIAALLQRLFTGGTTVTQADRDAVIDAVVAQTGLSRDEVVKRVQQAETSYRDLQAKAEQAKEAATQKAREVADAAAQAVSRTALWGFAGLLLGAIAAAIGGAAGRPRELLGEASEGVTQTWRRT